MRKLPSLCLLVATLAANAANGPFALKLVEPPRQQTENHLAKASAQKAVNIPRLAAAPAIDGKISPQEWAGALSAKDFQIIHSLALQQAVMKSGDGDPSAWLKKTLVPTDKTEAFLGCSGSTLHIAARCADRNPKNLKAAPSAARDSAIYGGDCFDVFLSPDSSAYYHFIADWRGVLYDAKHSRKVDAGHSSWTGDQSWNAKDIACASSVDATGWSVEFAIPFAAVGLTGKDGEALTLNLGREAQTDKEYSAWGPCANSFHEPESFIPANVAKPSQKPLRLSDVIFPQLLCGENNIEIGVENLLQSQQAAHIAVAFSPTGRPEAKASQTVTLPPGKTAAAQLCVAAAEGAGILEATVADSSGVVDRFRATVSVPPALESIFPSGEFTADQTEMRFQLGVNVAPSSASDYRLDLSLSGKQDLETFRQSFVLAQAGDYQVTLNLKPIPEGQERKLTVELFHGQEPTPVQRKQLRIIKYPSPFNGW